MDGSRLLVLCTANVCRSPLAAAVLTELLPSDPFEIASAGVRGLHGAPMCEVAASRAPDDAVVVAHRSRELTEDLVRSADLVLTMERAQRSSAVRLAPGSQATVFTLREAQGLLAALRERGTAPVAGLSALAAAMHGARGTVPLPQQPAPRRRWWQSEREPADPLTIEDGHGLELAVHERAVDDVRETAQDVGGAIRSLVRTD